MLDAMMQTELRIKALRDEKWHGDSARRYCAKLLNGCEESSVSKLMHYQSNGQPASGLPLIRFGGGKEFFRIVALGDEANDVLASVQNLLRRQVSLDCEVPVHTETISSTVSIATNGRLRFYRVYSPVLTATYYQFLKLKNVTREDLFRACQEKLTQGINRQINALNMDVTPESAVLKVVSVGEMMPLKTKAGDVKQCKLLSRHIDFVSNIHFEGHWAIGSLISRGYGVIRPLYHHDTISDLKITSDDYAEIAQSF